jgi:DNA-binding NarL/FixJ family response regulator
MNPITVLLADDHAVVRAGLRSLLDAESGIEVVGEAQTGREAVQLTKKLLPAVVVMDIAMPLLNGLEATRQILKAVPSTKVIILSAHSDDEYVDEVIRIGAAGYLVKQTSAHVLSDAIRQAYTGKAFFDPFVSKRLENRQQNVRIGATALRTKGNVGLTSREIEILQLIAEGKANKQTADELGISIKTVEKHRQNLMSKLDIHDTAGLTRYAIAAGIIESGLRSKLE